jgi:hypothetical protein
MNTLQSLFLASVAGLTITSCVVSDYPGGPPVGGLSSAFGVYDVLPDTYDGDAYYYQNRYYYGGRYEQGVFHDHGRQYNDRYYHAGQYYYGGRNEHHANRSQPQSRQHDSRNDGRDHDRR